jgi:NADPH-dependent 2,4-dienoyl-CoA reductase/sulfur reductase-like enzyme/Pyruvate/2-oxoacid:ferredoxin oxidoreductase delta subunit
MSGNANLGTELLVIGAGPAGLGAATEAAARGVRVLVVDENDRPGGQLYKQIHKFFGSAEHQAGTRGFRIAESLVSAARAAGTDIWPGHRAIGVLRDGRMVLASGHSARAVRAQRIVIATGGRERALPFPGWTLPGIMTAGAAQTLCNIHRILPAKRGLMVGSGNVGLIVAYQLLQAGMDVAGIVEVRDRAGGYQVHEGKLRRHGIPFFTTHRVVEAYGDSRLSAVRLASLDGSHSTTIAVDGLFLAVGLNPSRELATMLGCQFGWESSLGGACPLHDAMMRSSVAAVYVAGDAAGIEEANTSLDEGRLAGIAVAADLGKIAASEALRDATIIQERLIALRSGIHGTTRLEAKQRLTLGASPISAMLPDDSRPPKPPGPLIPPRPPGPPAGPILALARRLGHAIPRINCPETIPCNPCVTVCPAAAISMVGICGIPHLDPERCTGCMQCAAICPGQAIFMIGPASRTDQSSVALARVTVPWEHLPTPQHGERVVLFDRSGKQLGLGTVSAVILTAAYDRTRLVTLTVPQEYAETVESFGRTADA